MTRLRRLFFAFAWMLLPLAAGGLAACSAEGMVVGGAATAGVAAAQERGLSGAVSDTEIRLEINHLWLQHDEEMYRKVGLQVQEGRVLLTGSVPTPEMRLDAVRLAWQANGVKEVINEISVGDGSLTGFARDTWISTQLKGKLLLDKEVSAINYSIETVEGVIYLMGVAQNAEELERVTAHARNIAYVRRVVSYVQMKDDPARREEAS